MIKADLGWGVIALDIYSGMLSDDKKKEPSMWRIKGQNFQDRGNSKSKNSKVEMTQCVKMTVGNREGMVEVREVGSNQVVTLFGSSKEIFIVDVSIF